MSEGPVLPGASPSMSSSSGDGSPLKTEQVHRLGLLGFLAAGLAHDFNNVMTVVLGSLEQLQRQPLDERGRKQLARAQWGVQQAARLTNQALAVVSRKPLETHVVDLNQATEEFHGMLGEVAGDQIAMELRLAPRPLPVRLNAGGLELALLNLLRNAVDAMPETGHVRLETTGPGVDGMGSHGTVEVSVTDTGSGMPAEAVNRATEAFFTTKEQGRGTGLGLWMVQQFVAAAGGKVVIETEQGRGTTVRLRFPLAKDSSSATRPL